MAEGFSGNAQRRLWRKDREQAGIEPPTTPGKHYLGGGLILHVIRPDRRNWLFRYSIKGRERVMGLGSAELVSDDDVRLASVEARKLLARGIDPLEQREAERQAKAAATVSRTTFA